MARWMTIVVFLMFLVGCGSVQKAPKSESISGKTQLSQKDKKQIENINNGRELIRSGKPTEAVEKYLYPAIDYCNEQKKNTSKKIYNARTTEETVLYIAMSAVKSEDAVVIDTPSCGEAFFLTAYAAVELRDIEAAQKLLTLALEYSPANSSYLSEMGHTYQVQRKWKEAIKFFTDALEFAQACSPKEFKNEDVSRALRGIAFAFIETGRLEEAEALYYKCLKINANDRTAQQELLYIKGLREKAEQK